MKITPYATVLSSVVLLATAGSAQNLLTNPGFENGGLAGWNFFGPNVTAEMSNPPAVVPHTGNAICKMFGDFSGGFNVSGIFQAFPAFPGQTYTIDCWSRHWSGDPLTGMGAPNDNWVVMKMAFFDVNNNEIGNAERIILDGQSQTDVWIDNVPVSGTAPTGTVRVEAFVLFLQPGVAGGSAQIDDVEFTGPPSMPAYPGTGEDLVLSSAVGGAMLSSGPGNDIKTVPGGSALELNVASPGSTFDLKAYTLIGELFGTGQPPVPMPAFPELWFNFSSFFVLVNGLTSNPVGPSLIGPNGGTSTFYVAPVGLPGLSVIVQGLVIDGSAGNGLYTATDAHELRFQ